MSRGSAISAYALSKSFDGVCVLHDINLEVKSGQSVVILGGSGSGKSVLLKSILGIILPDPGSKVLIDQEDVTNVHIKDRHRFIEKFGMLFQGSALFDSLPVWHNICFHMLYKGKISEERARIIAAEKLRLVDIAADKMDSYPAQLSGGMQKRVALARAIADDPAVIFFDEPTAGLDPINSQAISQLIANFSKHLNATTVTITHDMRCMRKIADNVVMLDKGRVVWSGPQEEMQYGTNAYLKAFISAAG